MNDVVIRVEGRAGRITLNRPNALNALTHEMILDIEKALLAWRSDTGVALVVIDGAGDRAFCSGGDISKLYETNKSGDYAYGRQFWADEYRLNYLIATYPKPYVAIADKIVMGGGVGVSLLGSHRIVTERTMFAMPECSIGLVPDVGGSLLLSRMPGRLGEYCGLTGRRLNGAECLYAGVADYLKRSDDLEAVTSQLCKTGDVACIDDFEHGDNTAALPSDQAEIDTLFTPDTLSEIRSELKNAGTELSESALKGLDRAAPLSALVALRMIRQARKENNIAMALRAEYRFVSRVGATGELVEGIRAAIIDKDRQPKWTYDRIDTVPEILVKDMFAPAPGGDVILEERS